MPLSGGALGPVLSPRRRATPPAQRLVALPGARCPSCVWVCAFVRGREGAERATGDRVLTRASAGCACARGECGVLGSSGRSIDTTVYVCLCVADGSVWRRARELRPVSGRPEHGARDGYRGRAPWVRALRSADTLLCRARAAGPLSPRDENTREISR